MRIARRFVRDRGRFSWLDTASSKENRALMSFDRVLSRQDRLEIERARKTLAKTLDDIEFE